MATSNTQSASYLPDELLLEILAHFEKWEKVERQTALARFSAVNRQWYNVCKLRIRDCIEISLLKPTSGSNSTTLRVTVSVWWSV
jgi:hypothetical protein